MFIVLVYIGIILIQYIQNKSYNSQAIQDNSNSNFKAGINYAFSLIQVCLYKMWYENSILDFDSINNEINNNLTIITQNQEIFNTWLEKFNEYIKNKQQEDTNDI